MYFVISVPMKRINTLKRYLTFILFFLQSVSMVLLPNHLYNIDLAF